MPRNQKKGIDTSKKIGSETATQGDNHLLVIAIDEYEHCPPLNNCVKDAKELIEILDIRYGISINAELPPLFNGDATKESITQSFRKLAEKVNPQDNVLIYFSGHGEYDKVLNQGYWVPVEAKKGRVDTYLPNSEVLVFLEAIKSHHTFMMVDSCFSGTLFVDKKVDKNIERLEQDPSRWGLTSGRNEIVSDGEVGKNSPFAESLLYRLKQNTGSLGVMQLCTLVLEQVVANAIQTPRGEPLRVGGHKGGQFVFKLKSLQPDNLEYFTKTEKADRPIATETEKSNFISFPHEVIIGRLPRGYVVIQDIEFAHYSQWHISADYFDYDGNWIRGTHYHESYRQIWESIEGQETQCAKLGIQKADWDISYPFLYLIIELRARQKDDTIENILTNFNGKDNFYEYYKKDEKIGKPTIPKKYVHLNKTGEIRDIIEVLRSDSWKNNDLKALHANFESSRRKAYLFLFDKLKQHPALAFVKEIIETYDESFDIVKLRDWGNKLSDALEDACRYIK